MLHLRSPEKHFCKFENLMRPKLILHVFRFLTSIAMCNDGSLHTAQGDSMYGLAIHGNISGGTCHGKEQKKKQDDSNALSSGPSAPRALQTSSTANLTANAEDDSRKKQVDARGKKHRTQAPSALVPRRCLKSLGVPLR